MNPSNGTETATYTRRLRSSTALWKRLLGVQRLYGWNLRRMNPGFLLDLGCGIGRNLRSVAGRGVGIDHNRFSVELARSEGFEAYTPQDFLKSEYASAGRFDSILISHVLEHLTEPEAVELLGSHLPYLRKGGLVIAITPQERGYRSDATHRRFMGFDEVEQLCTKLGLRTLTRRSFPFPRKVGRFFTHNEFITVAQKPST